MPPFDVFHSQIYLHYIRNRSCYLPIYCNFAVALESQCAFSHLYVEPIITAYINQKNLVMCPFYGIFQMCNFDTDIGTEELAHMEMVYAIVYQITKDLTMEEIEANKKLEIIRKI